jgi:hypothetical protein
MVTVLRPSEDPGTSILPSHFHHNHIVESCQMDVQPANIALVQTSSTILHLTLWFYPLELVKPSILLLLVVPSGLLPNAQTHCRQGEALLVQEPQTWVDPPDLESQKSQLGCLFSVLLKSNNQ